jgi:hypothetical protein
MPFPNSAGVPSNKQVYLEPTDAWPLRALAVGADDIAREVVAGLILRLQTGRQTAPSGTSDERGRTLIDRCFRQGRTARPASPSCTPTDCWSGQCSTGRGYRHSIPGNVGLHCPSRADRGRERRFSGRWGEPHLRGGGGIEVRRGGACREQDGQGQSRKAPRLTRGADTSKAASTIHVGQCSDSRSPGASPILQGGWSARRRAGGATRVRTAPSVRLAAAYPRRRRPISPRLSFRRSRRGGTMASLVAPRRD